MKKTWRIAPPLALATTLHAMVLTGVVQWRGADAGGAARQVSTHAASLSVRVAQALSSPVGTISPPAPDTVSTPDLLSLGTAETADAADDKVPEPVQALPADPVTPPDTPHPDATTPPTPLATEAAVETGQPNPDPDRYHARRELSRPPKALSPIDIVFPPGVPTPGRHTAVLAIYIDEQGHVRKVRTEGEALPLAFEDAARNAFLSAQFRAGELEGRTVKSYIHVEVVFDEQPEARGLSVSSLGLGTR